MLDLAIFGSKPLFAEQLCVNRPNVGNRNKFLDRVNEMFDCQIFTNGGSMVSQLEHEISDFLNVKHCVLTCNGTMALQLISQSLGLQGEVIVPSFTFIATAHAMLWQGLTPVFCDVDIHTNNIDPLACEKLITEKTSAILAVHLWGRPCDTEKLEELAAKYNLKLFFDSAHAFGCSHQEKMIANFGVAEAFSFHATKVFHTFEGGAVTTNDSDLAYKVRKLRNFGFVNYDCVNGIGINGKMTEVCAAMGLTNLECIQKTLNKNKLIYTRYYEIFSLIEGITIQKFNTKEKCNYQYIVINIDETITGIGRDLLVKLLHAENIMVRRYFYPGCHLMEPYASNKEIKLKNTEYLSQHLMVLPAGSDVTVRQVEKITDLIQLIIRDSVSIKEKLKEQ